MKIYSPPSISPEQWTFCYRRGLCRASLLCSRRYRGVCSSGRAFSTSFCCPGGLRLVRDVYDAFSRLLEAALSSGSSPGAAPRSHGQRARSSPTPVSPRARGAPCGGVPRRDVRSRVGSDVTVLWSSAGDHAGLKAAVSPPVLAFASGHDALLPSKFGRSPYMEYPFETMGTPRPRKGKPRCRRSFLGEGILLPGGRTGV